MNKILCCLIVGALGCGGSDVGDSFRTTASGDDSSGEGGGEDGEAGGDSTSSSGGEDGQGASSSVSTSSSTSTSSSQGSGPCQPTVTCASVGAECGTIQDDGCGNSIECPNNCSGVNTCGGSGDQFKCGCTPLTSENFPENTCGSVSDGCGGTVEFSTDCGDDQYVTCGGLTIDDESGDAVPGDPNTCNGGCKYLDNQLKDISCQGHMNTNYQRPDLSRFWRCPFLDLQDPPSDDCLHMPDGTGTGSWCCTTQE